MAETRAGREGNSGKSERIAILIIHGIGDQSPFDTLDGFARGFHKVVSEAFCQGREPYRITQRERLRSDPGSWESWQQYYVSLESDDDVTTFDIHEYYWAYRMTDQASLGDIMDWLDTVSRYARRYYERDHERVRDQIKKEGKDSSLNRLFEPSTGKFHQSGYLNLFGWLIPLMRFGAYIEGSSVLSFPFVKIPYDFLMKWVRTKVIDYLGDVVVYTASDRKAKHFGVRQAILRDARLAIESLLIDSTYDQILIAGHSLGSVIAYDALNRLHKAPPLTGDSDSKPDYAKIKGLVTFGSPLDKIAFFFQEEIGDDQWIKSQISNNLHSFKKKPLPIKRPDDYVELKDVTSQNLKNVIWLNFYDRMDPISGHLDAYEIDDNDNVLVTMGAPFGVAHIAYWVHEPMYEKILKRFFDIQPRTGPKPPHSS